MTCYVFNTLGWISEHEVVPDSRWYAAGTYIYLSIDRRWGLRRRDGGPPKSITRWKDVDPNTVPKEYRAAILLLT